MRKPIVKNEITLYREYAWLREIQVPRLVLHMRLCEDDHMMMVMMVMEVA